MASLNRCFRSSSLRELRPEGKINVLLVQTWLYLDFKFIYQRITLGWEEVT